MFSNLNYDFRDLLQSYWVMFFLAKEALVNTRPEPMGVI